MTRLTTTAAALLVLASPNLAAQEGRSEPWISFAPALLREGGEYTAAARFTLSIGARRHEVSRAFPSSRYWRIDGKGTVAVEAKANPDPLALDVAGGLSMSLAKPRVITFDPANVDAPGSAMEFDYGDLSLGAQAHIETNQRRTEARAALGVELIYTHDHQRGIWPFIPSVYATVGAARALASAIRDSLGVPDDESFLRMEAGAAWHISADRGWMPAPMKPVWLHGELALYRESGVEAPVGASGLNDGTRIALGAAYRLLGTERSLVDEIFIRWTHGETPTLPARRKAWMLGVVLAP